MKKFAGQFRITERLKRINKDEHRDFNFEKAASGLEIALDDVEIAIKALEDRNSLAMERALDRVELSLIEANPVTATNEEIFDSPEQVQLLEDIVENVELDAEESEIDVIDGEIIDLTSTEDEVDADWLLGEYEEENDIVDLTKLAEEE